MKTISNTCTVNTHIARQVTSSCSALIYIIIITNEVLDHEKDVKQNAKIKPSIFGFLITKSYIPGVIIRGITLACLICVLIKKDVSVRTAGFAQMKYN